MFTALTNAIIFTPSGEVAGTLILEDDRISSIGDIDPPSGMKTVDCGQHYIAPGFIDLQIYGGGGYLFSNQPSAHALKAMTDALVASGTTGYLLTLATNADDVIRQAIRVVKENPHPAVLGLHLEGPYLNPARRGAHLKNYIKAPRLAEIEALLEEAEGVIRMITLAPEICDEGIIELLVEHGVVVSAGHSDASFDEAVLGFKRGVTATTHLFNAMSPLHHRNTGLPGASFQTDNVYASIIADGVHVDFNTVSISKRILKERLFLITDAVEENLNGPYVHLKQYNRFTLPDGTLSGSQLTLLRAVENCVRHAGIALPEALRMAAAYPAQLINRPELGEIAPGRKANLVVFNKEMELRDVYLEGVSHKIKQFS